MEWLRALSPGNENIKIFVFVFVFVSEMVELGDNEAGRGGDYESALDCLICFIRQSHSSQDPGINHIPLISICHKESYYCMSLCFLDHIHFHYSFSDYPHHYDCGFIQDYNYCCTHNHDCQ